MPSSFETERDLLARFAEDIESVLSDPESAYSTFADLPADEELIDVIETFSDSATTVSVANLLTPRICGLPESAVAEWGSPDDYLLIPHADTKASDEKLWEADVQTLFTDDSARKDILDAYSLKFEGGLHEQAGYTSRLLLRLTNKTTGNTLGIRQTDIQNSSGLAEPFSLFDGSGIHLANLTEDDVFNLLSSLANDQLAVDPTADRVTRFKQYIYYLGERYGTTRKEHRLTGSLTPSEDEQDSYVYGGVIFAEEETPFDSRRSFVIERLQKCPQRNQDVLHKMRAEYANAPLPNHLVDDEGSLPLVPQLEKITCQPARFIITALSFDKEEAGISTPLAFGPDEIEMLNDTLQQVVASVSDRFMPAQL